MSKTWALVLAGAAAGAVNGLLGAGGGMVLIPLMTMLGAVENGKVFPSSVSVILPICLVAMGVLWLRQGLPWEEVLGWLPGSALGGAAAGLWGKKIPVKWLHRGFGLLIFWGGLRYLWG